MSLAVADHDIVICIGSNIDEKETQVASAIAWLQTELSDMRNSSVYASDDCNGGNRRYLNAVAAGKTQRSIDDIVKIGKEYEVNHGRTAEAKKKGIVAVDIDVVIYDGKILRVKDYEKGYFKRGLSELTTQIQDS